MQRRRPQFLHAPCVCTGLDTHHLNRLSFIIANACNIFAVSTHLYYDSALINTTIASLMESMHTNNPTFEEIVQRYRQQLTRVAYHLCGNREAALDIVQETFVDAYKGFAGLREPEKAGGWLYAILRRKAMNYHRARKPEVELMETHAVTEPDDTESIVRGIVIEQMSKLSNSDREILAGKYLLGLSYKELAESMCINEGAIRTRCLRAKERLGDILRGVGLDIPEKR